MEETNAFSRFDVVSDDSDHHFFGAGCSIIKSATGSAYKSIMREWKILEQNLPESIYVRVYERRIDLLRAVIVGAAGTPYHDGLFFFDIAFPSDYPTQPPKVHFHSFGLRLNPNLYTNGVVCLSLLNTWPGKKKTERWDPSCSNMLQLLLSLQALVLNENPFFNEPMFDFAGHFFPEKTSRDYNEQVFEVTCHVSVYLLRKPPKNFEAFVNDHFRRRGLAILRACNEYANGRVRIGYYYDYHSNEDFDFKGLRSSSSSTVKVSRTFKVRMEKLYPQLLEAFKRSDASLGSAVENLELEINRTRKVQENERKKKGESGILKNAMGKIKRVLGWKSSGKKKVSGIEGREMAIMKVLQD